MHSLARKHPLVAENKLLAWAGRKGFLLMNAVSSTCSVDEAEELVPQIARGEAEVPGISGWIRIDTCAE